MNPHLSQSVTIGDVARAAGVSVSTVSRILNGKPDVAAATRQHVLSIIETLGYIPSVSAQNLVSRRSRTIALLFPADYTGLTQLELDFFVGAAAAVEAQQYFLNLITASVTPQQILNHYKSSQADGLILMRVSMIDTRAALLRDQGVPFVMIGRCDDNEGLSYVDLDLEAAHRVAFEHLYTLGHRAIGLIARPNTMREELAIGAAVRSLAGYLQACEQVGAAPFYCEPEADHESVYAAAHELFQQEAITAMIVSNGAAAVPVLRAARERGLRIPQDFSLIALTTEKIANLVTPHPTTINFPSDRMGYLAAEMLLRRLAEPNSEPESILLAPELMIRETTAAI
jgi:DNA-binding LacI/PurR family transcriptional regulator